MIDVPADDPLAPALRLLQDSRFAEARELLSEHCRAQPESGYGWFLLGAACHALGDLNNAKAALETACRLAPEFVQALNALAAVELASGDASGALAHYRRALELEPRNAQLWANVGVVYGTLGQWEYAVHSYDSALEHDPGFVPALMNRGVALSRFGRFEDALANNDRFAQLHDSLADAHYNRAEVLLALLRYDEALSAAERACKLAPRHAGAHFDRGLALTCMGRLDEADAAFDTSRGCDPDRFTSLCRSGDLVVPGEDRMDTRGLYLLRMMARHGACDWRRADELAERFEVLIAAAANSRWPIEMPELAFSSLSRPFRTETRLTLARSVAAGFARRAVGHEPVRSANAARDRIRVAYVSPDFRFHAVGLLLQDLFKQHDRARFEIFAYSLEPDDGSDIRKRIVSGVDHWRDVGSLSDDAIAQRIADDAIDVLVDLAGYTKGARAGVFARRPAAVQVNYLGYAGSLGAAYVDYAIVDNVLCPAGSDISWSEKLVRLPAAFAPAGTEIPRDLVRRRADVGLPDSGFVFCCFASNHKIDPSIFGTWMSILTQVKKACLWVSESDPQTRQNLSREAKVRGVDPRRLIFAAPESFPAYTARYGLADLFLDTRWFNAHTTAIDALRCGVPVLTLAGETMPSRLGASVLNAAGLPELITRSLEEYEARAIELARSPLTLEALRDKVRRTLPGSALLDTQARARELETTYSEMVRRRRQGLAPEAFNVNAAPHRFNWF
jgi:predicted O-linked N-acetylglucosamine transferase (SPINDLY family)